MGLGLPPPPERPWRDDLRPLPLPEWLQYVSVTLGGSNLDTGYGSPEVRGLVPLAGDFFDRPSLLAAYVRGSWAKAADGDSLFEGALGPVLTVQHGSGVLGQLGLLYQHRHDTRDDLDFRLIAGTAAVHLTRGRLSLYAGSPLSSRQKVKPEDRSTPMS